MWILLSLLIVAAESAATNDTPHPYANEVFRCDFAEGWDANYDRWPDGWSRRRGEGYPHFIEINLVDDPDGTPRRCLEMVLDGGAATVYSPPIDVRSSHTYVFDGWIKTAGLRHDEAYFTITMLDAQRRRLDTFRSSAVGGTSDWTRAQLGPVWSSHPDAHYAVIGMHLAPTVAPDLKGKAWFTDLWMGSLPRLALGSNASLDLHDSPEQVEIRCDISGLTNLEWTAQLTLEGPNGQLIDEAVYALSDAQPEVDQRVASKDDDSSVEPSDTPPAASYSSSIRWQPTISRVGFYRVRATILGSQGPVQQRELDLAVIEPQQAAPRGEFGWTLPQGDHPLPLPTLAQLLGQVGVHWVKFPMWYDASDATRTTDLTWFTERLRSQGIGTIGLLYRPPASVRAQFGDSASLSAADLLTTPQEVWYPSLETVMLRTSLSVRRWQLGDDRDTSLVGFHDLERRIAELKAKLDEVGHDVQLGFGWNWLDQSPVSDVPWRFQTMSADPPLTDEELTAYLSLPPPQTERHVALEPLDRDQYDTPTRAADLVWRMLAAKTGGADAIFLPDPFNDRHGLMKSDGTPGALLLPWRTTALALAGTEYLGSLTLPGGSHNAVFVRADTAVMVVWNEQPTREELYLGEDVSQVDIWGHRTALPLDEGRQSVEVGPLPTFVVGLNRPIAEWRMAFQFERERLPSVFGTPHAQALQIQNFFPGGAGGRMRLITPSEWFVSPHSFDFELAAGEVALRPLEILFPFNADSGLHRVEAEFELTADRAYRFSAYRQIGVGLGDVVVELGTQLLENGDLLVEQRLTNHTDQPISFTCNLFAPQRRRIRQQILRIPRGTDVTTYRLTDGAELIGQMLWLRADEVGGQRSLNYHVRATE